MVQNIGRSSFVNQMIDAGRVQNDNLKDVVKRLNSETEVSLSEVQNRGLSLQVAGIHSDLQAVYGYKQAGLLAQTYLNAKHKIISDVQDIITEFKKTASSLELIKAGSFKDQALKALQKLQTLVNTPSDSGEYLCSGLNQLSIPIQRELAEILPNGDIVNSSIVNNEFTANYTDTTSTSHAQDVKVSKSLLIGIDNNDVYIGNNAFKKLIGALQIAAGALHIGNPNQILDNNDFQRIQSALKEASDGFDSNLTNTLLEMKKLTQATSENEDMLASCKDTITELSPDSAQVIQQFSDTKMALMLLYNTIRSMNEVVERVLFGG